MTNIRILHRDPAGKTFDGGLDFAPSSGAVSGRHRRHGR